MKVLFDTSVLVAAMIEDHPQHARCLDWLQQAREGKLDFTVGAHTLAELFAVLSSYPTRPRLSPAVAARLVRENVVAGAHIVALSVKDYEAVIGTMAGLSLAGGVVYDALITRAASKAGAERLLTLNPRDLLRVWPGGAAVITAP